jgi:hypothetical protein
MPVHTPEHRRPRPDDVAHTPEPRNARPHHRAHGLADHAGRLGRFGPPDAGVHPRDHAGPDPAGAAMTDRPEFNQDFTDLIQALHDSNVDFMIVGAHALAFHGLVRATGDLDILVRPSAENAERVVAALDSFGAPLSAHGVAAADFGILGTVYQIGLPPRRVTLGLPQQGFRGSLPHRPAEGRGAPSQVCSGAAGGCLSPAMGFREGTGDHGRLVVQRDRARRPLR